MWDFFQDLQQKHQKNIRRVKYIQTSKISYLKFHGIHMLALFYYFGKFLELIKIYCIIVKWLHDDIITKFLRRVQLNKACWRRTHVDLKQTRGLQILQDYKNKVPLTSCGLTWHKTNMYQVGESTISII